MHSFCKDLYRPISPDHLCDYVLIMDNSDLINVYTGDYIVSTGYGHPRLKEHLAAVIALMKASANWTDFIRNINRALPTYGDTVDLKLDVDLSEQQEDQAIADDKQL